MPGKYFSFNLIRMVLLLLLLPVFAQNTVWATSPDNPHGNYEDATSACAACHSTHSAEGASLLTWETAPRLCYYCHDGSVVGRNIAAEFGQADSGFGEIVSYHPVPEGTLDCTDCHNPHLTPAQRPALLSAGSFGEYSGIAFCGTCHGDGSLLKGGAIAAAMAGTAHDTLLAGTAGGTGISCSRCHQPHGSTYAALLHNEITDEHGSPSVITGNDNTLCLACHHGSLRTYGGGEVYGESKHGATVSSAIADTVYPGTTYEPGMCLNCHEPHGRSGSARYTREVGTQLCLGCHREDGLPAGYSYRGITAYMQSPHATARRPSALLSGYYRAGSPAFTAWEGLQNQSPHNPGTPVVSVEALAEADNNHLSTALALNQGDFNTQMFRFTLSEKAADVVRLKVFWSGYGEPTPEHPTQLSLWNTTGNGGLGDWEILYSEQTGAEVLVDLDVDTAADYINGQGEIYLLAAAMHDATPPGISNITHTLLTAAAPHSVRVSWNTDESADSRVDYGTTSAYGYTLSEGALKTSHSLTITGLAENTQYHFRVHSADALGNTASSADQTFTLARPPVPTLVPAGTGTKDYPHDFTWQKAANPAVQYKVQLSGTAAFTTIRQESLWLSDNGLDSQTWTVVLNSGSTTYWRVKARYAHSPTLEAVSATGSFFAYSCPILYTWNGERFVFVTDIAAGANVGLETAPGRYLSPVADEQAVIQAGLLEEKDGYYTIKLKNELDEIDYIDNIRLVAVDHPLGTAVALNDFMRHKEPFTLYSYSEQLNPVRKATYINNPTYSGGGEQTAPQDVTELVSALDNRHAHGTLGDDNQFIFDLGDLREAEHIKLVVVGWTEFMNPLERLERVEKSKSGIKRAADLVEVLQPDGSWLSWDIKHIPGHTKTAVLDLSGAFAQGTQEFVVRLRGLYRPRLDFVGVDTTSPADLLYNELELVAAELEYGGIAERRLYPAPYYDYDSIMDVTLKHAGRFTRYGDVLPLVSELDDRLVVMDTGDELTLHFLALTPPAPGMTRSFLLKPWVYYKELEQALVEPLPFRAMDFRNFPESLGEYPEELLEYHLEWNTRIHQAEVAEKQRASIVEPEEKSFFGRFSAWLAQLFASWRVNLRQNEASLLSRQPTWETVGKLHYSLNTNFVQLEVVSSLSAENSGYCTNCHAVHDDRPAKLHGGGSLTCFGNDFGCHSDRANSPSGAVTAENFTAAAGHTARHSVAPAEQEAFGTKVECANCHNPHLSHPDYKTIDPFDTTSFISQWEDRGIARYLGEEGVLYLLARGKKDGTPATINQIDHTTNAALQSATVTWQTDKRSTRQLEWIATPQNYEGSVPDENYYEINSAGSPGTFFNSPHTLTITALQHGLDYHYRIRSEDEAGNVAYSSDGDFNRVFRLSASPDAPENLRHSPEPLPSGNHTEAVWLEWDEVADSEGGGLQYWVEIRADGGWLVKSSGWLPVGQTYWDTTVSSYAEQTYQWRVRARSIYGAQGPFSGYAFFTHIGEDSSCPVLYAWNGLQYEFVTDIAAGANLGLQLGSGKYLEPVPDEQVVIPGRLLAEKDGYYSIIIKNDMNEIDYIDNIRLQAVDHPLGTEIALNDFTRHREPFRIYTFSEELRPLRRAVYVNNPTYSGGRLAPPVDVTELVSTIDDRHAVGSLGDDNQFIFDLGDLRGATEIKLVIVGWTEFMNSAEKAERVEKGNRGIKRAADVLEVLQPDGTWQATDIRHIPGHTKTMVLDLTGAFAPETEHFAVRLRGLYRPHFDFVGVDTSVQADVTVSELELAAASLSYGGFSQRNRFPKPYYDYYSQLNLEIVHEGMFTRYGDVLPLVRDVDDLLVVMDTGDELSLKFAAIEPPPPGMTRSYILVPWVYYKETFAATVAPVPWRGMDMSQYPHSLGDYPEELRQSLEQWNTRVHTLRQEPEIQEVEYKPTWGARLAETVRRWRQQLAALFRAKPGPAEYRGDPRRAKMIEASVPVAQKPSHYSLNTNYAAVTVATQAGNLLLTPDSPSAEAWESDFWPTFDNPGNPATTEQRALASLPGPTVWSTDLAAADGYNYQLFCFPVPAVLADIRALSVSWTGYGAPTVGYNTWLYIWDYDAADWRPLSSGLWPAPRTVEMFRNLENSGYCNRCHDNNPPEGVLMGELAPTDIAASVISDYHGDFSGSKARLIPPYTRGSRRLACDDCHDPHGSASVFHLRENVNFTEGIIVEEETGRGAESFCRACHTGSFVGDWHGSCYVCHNPYMSGDHYFVPVITESLLADCFRCHGHGRGFEGQTSCNLCKDDPIHAGKDHDWPKAF